jgi:hypothetical protein
MRRQIFVFIVILGTEAQGRKPAAFHSDKVWAGPWGHGWNTSRKLHSVLYSTGPLPKC